MTITATYPKLTHDWLKHETDPNIGREEIVIPAGTGLLETGTLLGQITVAGATSAAKTGGNTGNGTLTLDATTPVLAGAMAGVYSVRCIAAASNGGRFEVQNPDGVVIGAVDVAATWAEGVKFVIADGANDFIVGDGFDITVAAGNGKWVPCNLAAVNGSQVPAGLLYRYTNAAGDEDVYAVAVVSDAEIVLAEVTFHGSFDNISKKRTAMDRLRRVNRIKTRPMA